MAVESGSSEKDFLFSRETMGETHRRRGVSTPEHQKSTADAQRLKACVYALTAVVPVARAKARL